jgi:hypothetical protein
MIAYDYEVLQSKDLFTEEIRDTVDKLPRALTFSAELNDFIMQFLILNPKDRPKCCAICRHPWLAGSFDVLLVSRGNGNGNNNSNSNGHQVQYNNGGDCYRGGGRTGMAAGSYSSNNSVRIGNFGSPLTHGLSNELHRTQPGTPTRLHSPQSNSSKSLNLRPVGSFAESSYASKCSLPSLNIMSPRESFVPMSPLFIEGETPLGSEKSPCPSPRAALLSHTQIMMNPKGFSGLDSKEKVLLENYIRSRSGSFIGSQVPTRRNTIGDIIPVVDMSPWQRNQGGGSGKISMSVSQSQDNFGGTEPVSRSPESRSSVQLPPISVDFNGSSSFTTNSNEKYSQQDDTANEFSTVNSSSFNTVAGASPPTDMALHSSLLALQLENALEDYDWGNLQQFNRDMRANDRDRDHDRVTSDKHASCPKKEYASGAASASSAGVSFYGYGNRNYSAPRGSFVTESTGPRGSFAFDQFSNLRSSMTDDGHPVRHTSFSMDAGSYPRGSFANDVSEKLYKKAISVNTSNKGGRINNESQPLGSKSKN